MLSKYRLETFVRRPKLLLISQGLFSVGARGLGAVVSFIFSWLIARNFGAHGNGLFSLAQTLIVLLQSVFMVGLDFTLPRYILSHAEKGDWGRVKALVAFGLTRPAFFLALFSFPVFALGMHLYAREVGAPELVGVKWLLLASTVSLGQLVVSSQILRALGYFELSQLSLGLMNALVSVISLICFVVLFDARSTQAIFVSFLLGPLTVGAAASLICWHRARFSPSEGMPVHTTDLIRESYPFAIAQALNFGIDWSITLVLGIFATVEEVGVYRIAYLVGTAFFLISSGAELASGNPLCSAWNERNESRVRQILWTLRGATILLALPMALGCVLLRSQIAGFFGPQFAAGTGAIIVLVVAQMVNIATGPVGALLTACGARHQTLLASIGAALAGLIAAIALIPSMGIAGAAFASGGTIVVRNLLSFALAERQLRRLRSRPSE